jgi:hypothetical protein
MVLILYTCLKSALLHVACDQEALRVGFGAA